jgi:phasin
MANTTPGYEIPPQVREMAEKSVDEAKKAFDGFVTQAQKAVTAIEGQASAAQAGAKDFNSKAISFAEANVAASFEFAQKLVRAGDINEVVRLQTEYVQSQMKAFTEQAKELGAAATKAMTDAAKPRV